MDDMTSQTFLPHVGSEFRFQGPMGGDDVNLHLTAVRDLGKQPNAPRGEPFALEFAGPPQPVLDQRIYRLEHDELGVLEIFVVPIGYDAEGNLRYEAVFN